MKPHLQNNLDNPEVIAGLDSSNCLESIKYFPRQVKTSWYESQKLDFSFDNNQIQNIFFCGMGGSAYPGRIVKSLFKDKLAIPFEIVDGYFLPAAATQKSLIICVSYSGNTQETLSCADQALLRNLPVLAITGGGELAKLFATKRKSVYVFTDKLNPSRQPRLGQGYLISSFLCLLAKLNLIALKDKDIENLQKNLSDGNKRLEDSIETSKNQAKKLAIAFSAKIVNLVASEFLEGAVHAVRNPLNETGKHFAQYSIIPELNHHLLEGLKFPGSLAETLLFAFINSRFYSDKISRRISLTQEVVRQNGIETLIIDLTADSSFEQVFELIQLMTYVSFYLAIYHNVDPAPVPWVDYFKRRLL